MGFKQNSYKLTIFIFIQYLELCKKGILSKLTICNKCKNLHFQKLQTVPRVATATSNGYLKTPAPLSTKKWMNKSRNPNRRSIAIITATELQNAKNRPRAVSTAGDTTTSTVKSETSNPAPATCPRVLLSSKITCPKCARTGVVTRTRSPSASIGA